MVNGEAAIALTWSGQAADMMADNEDIDYSFLRKDRIYGLIIWSFHVLQEY